MNASAGEANAFSGIAIVGPTASGKTALAVEVAKVLSGEIISMDSRQVYRGMDIGTAKPEPGERSAVPHHGLDLLDPDVRYSAGRFAEDARRWLDEILARGHVPVLAGGTGFFLRALTQPMFPEPPLDRDRKNALMVYLDGFARPELMRWLTTLDEVTARRMETEGGRHRVARAVEVALLTGRTLSEWHTEHEPSEPALRFLTFRLELPREELYDRINSRADDMVARGLVNEVRALTAAGYDENAPGMNTVGYVEMLAHLRGELSLDDAVEGIRRATRRYARRQETWFRHQLPPDAVTLDATHPITELADEVKSAWRSLASA